MVNLNISPSMLFSDTYDEGNQRVAHSNIIVIVVLSVIVILFYLIFQSLGGGNNSSSLPNLLGTGNSNAVTDKGLNMLEIIMWGSLIFLVLINGLQYFFGINIKTSIKNIFTRTPEVDVSISPHGDEEGEIMPPEDEEGVCEGDSSIKTKEACEKAGYEWNLPEVGFCEKFPELVTKKACEENGGGWLTTFCRGDPTIKTRVACETAGHEWVEQESEGGPMGPDSNNKPPRIDGEGYGGGAGEPEIMIEKQVFHVPVNKYTYKDARALCGAFGGRLATYNEIEEAYKKGGEWCSYGWSKGQNIYFPTQKSTYKKLKKIKGHEHDCGREGINGGYVSNPNAKFGVNCMAPKPQLTRRGQQYMESLTTYPITKEEQDFKKQTTKYRNNLRNILVSPFNKQKWSQV